MSSLEEIYTTLSVSSDSNFISVSNDSKFRVVCVTSNLVSKILPAYLSHIIYMCSTRHV